MRVAVLITEMEEVVFTLAVLETDADVVTGELEPVTGVVTGAWIWPSPIWEATAPLEVTEATGLEMPNWVEYWYCPVPVTIIWRP